MPIAVRGRSLFSAMLCCGDSKRTSELELLPHLTERNYLQAATIHWEISSGQNFHFKYFFKTAIYRPPQILLCILIKTKSANFSQKFNPHLPAVFTKLMVLAIGHFMISLITVSVLWKHRKLYCNALEIGHGALATWISKKTTPQCSAMMQDCRNSL